MTLAVHEIFQGKRIITLSKQIIIRKYLYFRISVYLKDTFVFGYFAPFRYSSGNRFFNA